MLVTFDKEYLKELYVSVNVVIRNIVFSRM